MRLSNDSQKTFKHIITIFHILVVWIRIFSINHIKTEKRSRLLNVEDDMRVALSFLPPNINEIIKKHQAQIFH